MRGGQSFTEDSPSVQAHAEILQGVINRMAMNSAAAKAWCVSLVSAILVLVGDKENPALLYIGVIPTFLFLFLDTYYLSLEQGFRAAYRTFVTNLHSGSLRAEHLYEVKPEPGGVRKFVFTMLSPSVWPFYSALFATIVITKYMVANK